MPEHPPAINPPSSSQSQIIKAIKPSGILQPTLKDFPCDKISAQKSKKPAKAQSIYTSSSDPAWSWSPSSLWAFVSAIPSLQCFGFWATFFRISINDSFWSPLSGGLPLPHLVIFSFNSAVWSSYQLPPCLPGFPVGEVRSDSWFNRFLAS